MKNLYVGLCVFFLFLFSACISVKPVTENAIGSIRKVAVEEEELGELFLQENGLWAYLPHESEDLSGGMKEGAILLYGKPSQEGHSFVVVKRYDWGLELQRLDSDVLESMESKTLTTAILSNEEKEKWSICSTTDCMRSYSPGVVFHIYERNAERLQNASKHIEGGLPFHRTAIVRNSFFELHIDGELPKDFLGIASESRDFPTRGRVGTENCEIENGKKIKWPANFLVSEISVKNMENSTDAFIDCKGGTTSLAIPGLWRRSHPQIFGTFFVSPLISMKIFEFKTPDHGGLDLLTKFSIAVGTGDFAAADFWLERFVLEHHKKTYRDFIKSAADISVAANRPEFATRLLEISTQGNWNPATDGRWNYVRYRIEKQMGWSRKAVERYAKLPEFFEAEDDLVSDYLSFFWTRSLNRKNTEAKEKTNFIRNKKEWKKYLKMDQALYQIEGGFAPDKLSLVSQFMDKVVNPYDVFGRFPMPSLEEMLMTGISQHSLKMDEIIEGSKLGIERYILHFGYASTPARINILEALSDHNNCKFKRKMEVALAEIELRIYEKEVLDAEDEFLLWWLQKGREYACKAGPENTNTLIKFGEKNPSSQVYVLNMLRRQKNISLEEAKAITEFAAEIPGEGCHDFAIASAYAFLKAKQFNEAKKSIQHARKCKGSSSDSIEGLDAYIAFEGSGKIPIDISSRISKEVQRVVKSGGFSEGRCIGAEGFEYDLGGLIQGDSIADLIENIKPPDVDNTGIRLANTSELVIDGRHALMRVRPLLSQKKFIDAMRVLKEAEDLFKQASFLPGIYRVRFVRSVLVKKNTKNVKSEILTPSELAMVMMEKTQRAPDLERKILLDILEGRPLNSELSIEILCP